MFKSFILASILLTSTLCASFQHCDEQGIIKGVLKEVIRILNVDLNAYKQDDIVPANHIARAYAFLNSFCCNKQYAHEDREYFRRGGQPSLVIAADAVEQLLRLIRGSNALLPSSTPSVKKKSDVIIFAGLDWSLEKRLHSFKQFLEEGFTCDNVYILSINKELDACCRRVIGAHEELFKGITVRYVLVSADAREQRKDMLIQAARTMSSEYYLISCPEYASNLQESCELYGAPLGLTCLGVFARSITSDVDEYIARDIKGYKYDEFIKDPKAQRCAAAYASLHFLAYQVAEEMLLLSNQG